MPAHADTDYQCLNLCTNSGKPAAACLSACSYDAPASSSSHQADKSPVKLPLGQNHRIVDAPVDADSSLLLHKLKPQADSAPKDYVCMSNCLQESRLYSMCEQKCTPSLQKLKKASQ
jgi:hypothetical protein